MEHKSQSKTYLARLKNLWQHIWGTEGRRQGKLKQKFLVFSTYTIQYRASVVKI